MQTDKTRIINSIRDLISRDELLDVILSLKEVVDDNNFQSKQFKDEVLSLHAKLEKLKREIRIGSISHEQANIDRSKIRLDLIDICNFLENPSKEESLSVTDSKVLESREILWKREVGIISVMIIILALLFLMYKFSYVHSPFNLRATIKENENKILQNTEFRIDMGGKWSSMPHLPNKIGDINFNDIPGEYKNDTVWLNSVNDKYFVLHQTAYTHNEAKHIVFTVQRKHDTLVYKAVIKIHGQRLEGNEIRVSCDGLNSIISVTNEKGEIEFPGIRGNRCKFKYKNYSSTWRTLGADIFLEPIELSN